MTPGQPHQRLLAFLLFALAIACIVSPFLTLGADWFRTQWPALMPQRIPFHRTFDRAFMISGIVLFFFYRRALITDQLKTLLRVCDGSARADFFMGLGLAIGSVLLIITAMTAGDVFAPYFRVSLSVGLSRIAKAAATGIFTGALEEVFFRGILFMGLRTHGYRLRAYLLANLFYAALHFVSPGQPYFIDRMDLGAGFRHLAYSFIPFLDPLAILPGLLGLLLVGLVLSFAVERTGTLFLAIGLHAGWVFGLKSLRVFGDFKLKRDQFGFLFGSGDPKIVSGTVTWAVIVLTGAAVYHLTKSRAAQSSDLPRAVTA